MEEGDKATEKSIEAGKGIEAESSWPSVLESVGMVAGRRTRKLQRVKKNCRVGGCWLGCVGSHSPTPIPAKDNGVVFPCNYIHVLHTSDGTISGWW